MNVSAEDVKKFKAELVRAGFTKAEADEIADRAVNKDESIDKAMTAVLRKGGRVK